MSVETFLAAAAIKAKKAGIISLTTMIPVGAFGAVEYDLLYNVPPNVDSLGYHVVATNTQTPDMCAESGLHIVNTTLQNINCPDNSPQGQLQNRVKRSGNLNLSFSLVNRDNCMAEYARKWDYDHTDRDSPYREQLFDPSSGIFAKFLYEKCEQYITYESYAAGRSKQTAELKL